jgi:hypothetical protein
MGGFAGVQVGGNQRELGFEFAEIVGAPVRG